jgi:glucose-6-phosphate 1-epimerase
MGMSYIDKVLDATEHTESNTDIHISSEVDRVYRSIPQDTTTIKANGKSYIDVTRDNLPDTVVWNPWVAKSKTMADFKPQDGYKTMVCVEVGSVNGWQKLEAGDSFEAGMVAKAHI